MTQLELVLTSMQYNVPVTVHFLHEIFFFMYLFCFDCLHKFAISSYTRYVDVQ